MYSAVVWMGASLWGCSSKSIEEGGCPPDELESLQEDCLSYGGEFSASTSTSGLDECDVEVGLTSGSGACRLEGEGSCSVACTRPEEEGEGEISSPTLPDLSVQLIIVEEGVELEIRENTYGFVALGLVQAGTTDNWEEESCTDGRWSWDLCHELDDGQQWSWDLLPCVRSMDCEVADLEGMDPESQTLFYRGEDGELAVDGDVGFALFMEDGTCVSGNDRSDYWSCEYTVDWDPE